MRFSSEEEPLRKKIWLNDAVSAETVKNGEEISESTQAADRVIVTDHRFAKVSGYMGDELLKLKTKVNPILCNQQRG